ncbi:hypothetical protein HPB51_006928 [Rhipicephalus microplus]|uniref:Uncharacterized protein n=1 Tax=Rhipicephalus microplus TaxID=6941 RepID=A0A9J6DTS8_RHIMP|nr:hypothetical protein HPB51_006928 [Rhipicephalus microplus]
MRLPTKRTRRYAKLIPQTFHENARKAKTRAPRLECGKQPRRTSCRARDTTNRGASSAAANRNRETPKFRAILAPPLQHQLTIVLTGACFATAWTQHARLSEITEVHVQEVFVPCLGSSTRCQQRDGAKPRRRVPLIANQAKKKTVTFRADGQKYPNNVAAKRGRSRRRRLGGFYGHVTAFREREGSGVRSRVTGRLLSTADHSPLYYYHYHPEQAPDRPEPRARTPASLANARVKEDLASCRPPWLATPRFEASD